MEGPSEQLAHSAVLLYTLVVGGCATELRVAIPQHDNTLPRRPVATCSRLDPRLSLIELTEVVARVEEQQLMLQGKPLQRKRDEQEAAVGPALIS
ncbi:hypothetical protein L209DRAFT_756169 [Thermothelomyces heterothallicus CBS 203.75]